MTQLTPEQVAENIAHNIARTESTDDIRAAYRDAEKALRRVGFLLRTSAVKGYSWPNIHKTAVSGMIANIEMLWRNVPRYGVQP